MHVVCKTFEIYIREMVYHPERAKKWLADKRLTETEKTILRCHLLVRDNKNLEAIKEIEQTSKSDIPFVNDHKNLLLGICYNHLGKYTLGENHLNLALEGFEKSGQHYHLFTALYNLAILLGNIGRIQEMGQVVQRMEELRVDGVVTKIRLLRCQFMHAVDANDNKKAWKYIQEIKSIKSDMPESELGAQLVLEFIFYIKIEDLDKAELVLLETKKHKKFTLSENFNYMKGLLAYLRNDTTIYVYERMFSHSSSFLFYQMKVIECLQLGDKIQAQDYWSKLQKEHSADLYQDNFQWKGEKCLFSLCLDKKQAKLSETPALKIVKKDGPKHQVVYEILSRSKGPVKAAEIYEIIYDQPIDDKEDLRKLVRLIVSVREIYGVEVISKKGTYQLVAPVKKNQKII